MNGASLFEKEPEQLAPQPKKLASFGFFVPGIPATQGSKRAFIPKGWTRPILIDDCKRNKDWRGDVLRFAAEAFQEAPITSPVRLSIVFVLPRPKAHFNARGELRANAPAWHTKKPDRTKLTRPVEDALKGIAWVDDSQVCCGDILKVYGDQPGAQITIEALEG